MTTSLTLLTTLGMIILLVGSIVFIVSAFRVSIVWGLCVLLLPGAGLIFLLLHWGKARDGFVIVLVGAGLPLAAAYLLLDAEDREKLLGSAKEWVTNVTSPDPFAAQGKDKDQAGGPGGSKKPPPAIPQTQVLDFSSVGGAQAPADVGIRTPTTVVAPTAGLLENDVQVTAAMAELTQRGRELSRRKEQLKNSTDQADLIMLRTDIETYNKRLAEVKAAEMRIFNAKQQAYADQRLATVPKNKLTGSIQGRQVVFDSATLDRKRSILTLRQGDEKAPDVTLTVMFGGRVDEPFDKKRVIRDPAPDNSPAVSVNFRRGGSKSFNRGYGLYVDFAEDQPEGRIFLTLPDETKSSIQGTFRLGGAVEKKSG